MGKPMDQAGTTQRASPGRLIGQRKVGAIAAATGNSSPTNARLLRPRFRAPLEWCAQRMRDCR
jgi:hypothetical protein